MSCWPPKPVKCETHDWEDDERPCNRCREAKGLVECDDPDCEAREEPETVEELQAALQHWRRHHLSYGCSHGG